MYSKCGSIEGACQVFEKMVNRDVITWNAMIGGYAQHGYAREALGLFKRMLEERVRPNSVTFVGVLSACSRAGRLTEGRRFFTSVFEDHGIVPTMELYGCMVDLLGRAGELDEAAEFINNMPLEATASIWSSLLGACRIHGNLEIAERAAERTLRIDPHDGAVYVQLSHMYAAAGMWDDVAKVRKVMEDRGVKKEQGCTWIQVDGKVYGFLTEDRSHPQVREIYAELARLMREIKREGYVPLTQNVLHDVGELQKEEAISYHSEKLAIAFGIISTPPSTPIHIYKNLRVCADCHSASKFISKLAGREIIARDASRFHHFKDGVCSCGDYW
jgi:pentatricopeptide repeat protein